MRRVAVASVLAMLVSGSSAGLPLTGASPAAAAVAHTVTSTADTDDGACTPAHCTLREAIAAANANPGADTIGFDIGTGVPTIAVGSAGLGPLPHITDPVLVDGATGGATRVELNGEAAGGTGLRLEAGSTTIRHLVINRFSTGVVIGGSDATTGNVVEGSYIGTDATGTVDLGNHSLGVAIVGAVGNVIGPDNVISGNDEGGVALRDAGYANRTGDNVIRGNRIGTDVTGTAPLGNGRDGVLVEFASRFLVEGNVIAANAANGIRIASFTQAGFTGDGRVRANRIGTDATGASPLPNGVNGILLDRATNTTIGGTGAGDGNLISGNTEAGIRIDENFGEPLVPLGNRIQGNRIGTDAGGTAPLGNGRFGIYVDRQTGNTIGPDNVISANSTGVVIAASDDPTGNVVEGNLIGTDATGTADLGNRSLGVAIVGAVGNVIGPDNVISGNDEGGVALRDAGYANRTGDNVIRGNWIGTDDGGASPLGNGRDGVLVEFASRFLVEGNVLSANAHNGIRIASFTQDGFTGDGRVRANRIGTDAGGTVAVPNGANGILLDRATNTLVGGVGPGDGNLISGNVQAGIRIDENFGEPLVPLGNRIQGNRIGTDASGTADLGNHASGVYVHGQPGNTVGGSAAGAGNVISGNLLGVFLDGGATGNVVQGNHIGTDAGGTAPLPNEADGVVIQDASSNTIGGTAAGEGNVIAYNGPGFIGGAGVVVTTVLGSADSNAIRGNAIHDNTRLGIDLGDDLVTPNDAGDADTGPNRRQNFPVVASAEASGSATNVTGTLDSAPSTSFGLDFYASASCDPSGHGEGATYLGTTTVATDGVGQGAFTAVLPAVAAGTVITATATSPDGDTSELSGCRATAAARPGTLQFEVATSSVAEGAGVATITVTRSDGTAGSVTVDVVSDDGTATAGDYQAVATTLTFAVGQASASFTVPIVDDVFEEGDETMELVLSNPTGGASLGSPATTVLTIVDDDAPTGCTIVGTPGDDVLAGTSRDDVICGFGGDDVLSGGGGNDVLRGGPGDDRLDGGRADDVVDGGIGDDILYGGVGDDRIVGGPGGDELFGDAGNDRLDGADGVKGNDRLDGGAGVNTCVADPGDRKTSCR